MPIKITQKSWKIKRGKAVSRAYEYTRENAAQPENRQAPNME
jgi:hypothetical protein